MSLKNSQVVAWRCGYTLVEVLVAIAIIGLLIGLLFVGVQAVRESARRASCQSNLRQIGLALLNYESANRVLPYGNCRQGFSAHVHILPYLEEQARYDKFDLTKSELAAQNNAQRKESPVLYSCPSTTYQGAARINYLGNNGTGIFDGSNGAMISWRDRVSRRPNSQLTSGSFIDGTSNSACIAEVLNNEPGLLRSQVLWFEPQRQFDRETYAGFANRCASQQGFEKALSHLGVWTRGDPGGGRYSHILPPNQASCINSGAVQEMIVTAGSKHSGGVQVLFVDGSVHWITDAIELAAWRALGSRDGSESELSLY